MANTNAPNGFRPVRHLRGGTIRMTAYKLASATASNIFTGDHVKLLTTGYVDVAAAGDTGGIGVCAGFHWIDTDGTPRFEKRWPTGTVTLGSADATMFVYDDPDIVFEAQCTTGTSFTQAAVGGNCDITATSGNTATGISKHSIDLSTNSGAGSGTAQWRILALARNSETGDSARVEAIMNEHLLRSATGI